VAAVTLSSGALEATFIPELNLLGTSLRFHGEEFLALPGGLDAYRGLHTTGLPLLHPWANRLRAWAYSSGRTRVDLHGLDLHTDGRGHPIHGTMSARDEWSVTELAVRGRIARLRASFDYERPDLLAAFPFPHNLGVTIDVDGVGVSIATTVEPTGRRAVPVSFGYHPYLRLPGAPRSRWTLSMPRRIGIELDGQGIPTGRRLELSAEDAPIGARTFDDHFELERGRVLRLESREHRLSVEYGRGIRYGQIFAPPGKSFVCLEPMTAPTNALVSRTCPLARPGETFTGRFRIRPERLSR